MTNGNQFCDRPILNSPYSCPERHWELDDQGQPTQKIIEHRRSRLGGRQSVSVHRAIPEVAGEETMDWPLIVFTVCACLAVVGHYI